MGGYASERDNVIYVHGKDENGKDDFENKFTLDWDDRNAESYFEDIGDLCFITVGLEKTKDDKTYYKKFLSAYDAILYVKEHLTEGTVINVKGNLKYQLYNGAVIVKKEIKSIALSSADKDKYRANFTQTILLDKYSIGNLDKEKGVVPIEAKVIDYVKDYKGKEVKTFIPINKTFEFAVDVNNPDKIEKALKYIFKVKKDITEITFEGKFLEGATIVNATFDDLSDDLKNMIECGLMNEKEALAKCVVSTNREKRMILLKPYFKPIKEEGEIPQMARIEGKYKEDDLILDFMVDDEETEEIEAEIKDSDYKYEKNESNSSNDDDTSWLEELGI